MYIWISGLAHAGGIEITPDHVERTLTATPITIAAPVEEPRTRSVKVPRDLYRRFVPQARGVMAEATGGTPLRALEAFVFRAFRTLRQWHLRRAAIRDLGALDDRTLWDIGVDRAEIPATVAAMLENHAALQASAASPAIASRLSELRQAGRLVPEGPCAQPC